MSPYLYLAATLAVLAAFGGTYAKGRGDGKEVVRAEWKAYDVKAAEDARKLAVQQADDLRHRDARIQSLREELSRERPSLTPVADPCPAVERVREQPARGAARVPHAPAVVAGPADAAQAAAIAQAVADDAADYARCAADLNALIDAVTAVGGDRLN